MKTQFRLQRYQLPHLPLYNEVRVIKTLYDGHLMLQGQFRILLDHVGEGLQAYSNIRHTLFTLGILTFNRERNESCLTLTYIF